MYYHHDNHHGVVLTHKQFENLNDIINSSLHLTSYPLGGGTWLIRSQGDWCLQTPSGFFTFYRKSWPIYKRRVHRRIRLILRHGERTRGEPDANYEVWQGHGPQTTASRPRWHPLRRSARNARVPHQRRSKHAGLPKWHRTNPRKRYRRSRPHHVPRIRGEDTRTPTPNDHLESSDECSIEEETMLVEDSL